MTNSRINCYHNVINKLNGQKENYIKIPSVHEARAKTVLCYLYKVGCSLKNCNWAHSPEELRPNMCRFGIYCKYINTCSHLHQGDTMPTMEEMVKNSSHVKFVEPTTPILDENDIRGLLREIKIKMYQVMDGFLNQEMFLKWVDYIWSVIEKVPSSVTVDTRDDLEYIDPDLYEEWIPVTNGLYKILNRGKQANCMCCDTFDTVVQCEAWIQVPCENPEEIAEQRCQNKNCAGCSYPCSVCNKEVCNSCVVTTALYSVYLCPDHKDADITPYVERSQLMYTQREKEIEEV